MGGGGGGVCIEGGTERTKRNKPVSPGEEKDKGETNESH